MNVYENQCIRNINEKFGSKLVFIDVGSRWGLQRPWDQYPDEYLEYIGFDADEKECIRLNKLYGNNTINIK